MPLVALVSVLAMALNGFLPTLSSTLLNANAASSTSSAQHQFLTIDKTAITDGDVMDLQPGQSFTYQIKLSCSEQSCVNAAMTDPLPAALQGFALSSVQITPGSVGAVATWSENGVTVAQPSTIGSDTKLSVTFHQSFDGKEGLAVGTTAFVNVVLQVPADFSADDSRNGQSITNTATSTADNSTTDTDSADVEVKAAKKVAASIDKTWTPSTQTFDPGATSTIELKSKNASNVTVDTLTVQDPQSSNITDGATSLDENNPFRITDFTGFSKAVMPAGADTVRVDAYVQGSDGTWKWVNGTASSSYALPNGVSAAQVGGLRFTYSGLMKPGAADDVQIGLAQRATDRNTAKDLSATTSSLTNVAQAQTAVGTERSDVVTDDATYSVAPKVLKTTVTKSITPNRIPAGNTATGSITATNTQSAVHTLTISDATGFFDENTTFGGFSAPIQYPTGASSGTVVYHLLDGGDQTVSFASGETPAKPSSNISGFDIVFTGAGDSITGGAQSTASFTIDTSSSTPFGTATTKALTNTATSTVKAANGQTQTAQNSTVLTVIKPGVSVTLDKTVSPSSAVTPGENVIASLKSTTSSKTDYVKPTKIVVEDSWGKDQPKTGFWNAFNLSSVQPTQVPAGSNLTVEVQKSDGTWITIETAAAQSAAWLFSLTSTQLQSALPSGVQASSLTGIRFTYEKTDGTTFPASTTVQPYLGFTARAELRDGSGATDTVDGDGTGTQSGTSYTNTATTTGTGTTTDGKTVAGTATDTGKGSVIVYPGTVGPVSIEKQWDRDTVTSQSGQSATTHLNWKVGSGFDSVQISDPNGNENDVTKTVFNAFNLTAVNGIQASSTPYTNGWYLKYDTVTSVELYENNAWHTVPAPTGGWQNSDGSFKGYKLTDTEQANTTGVRMTLAPNDPARRAALSTGSDPYAPEPGTGVVTSNSTRTFDLVWQLRNTPREKTSTTGTFITGNSVVNTTDDGVVSNTVRLDATSNGKTSTDTDSDTIKIIDQAPGVSVKKTVSKNSLVLPAPGTDGTLPTLSYTLTATNTSTTKASYVRVTDPTPCSDTNSVGGCQTEVDKAEAQANPFSAVDDVQDGNIDTSDTPNPFNRQDLTGVTIAASNAAEVDLSASVVWLLHYDASKTGAARYTTTQTTAAAVNAMTSAQLADVVGISVTFQGTSPETTGGTISQNNALTIQLDTQVRSTLRSTGKTFIPSTDDLKTSNNRVFAQSYDPVTAPNTKTGDTSSASVSYSNGALDVSPTKRIYSGTIVQPNAKDPQTVTLAATQGNDSSVSPTTVTMTDAPDGTDTSTSSTDFWKNFDFTGLTGLTFPQGADRVTISAYGHFGTDGALAWKDGTPQAAQTDASAYTLPVATDQYDQISGLKFTFTRTDGTQFSTSPQWSAQITYTAVLRDTQRGTDTAVSFTSDNTATDLLSAQSHLSAGGVTLDSGAKTATAKASWTPGTAKLAINKLANDGVRSANAGDMIPWDITIQNTGTGYLDLTQVTDELPDSLVYTGEGSAADPSHPVVFTPGTLQNGQPGTLTTAPTVDASDTGKVVFTWAKGENRLQPGETAKIRIYLELEPGVQAGQKVVNHVEVTTKQKLDGVSNAIPSNGSGEVTASGDDGATTSDSITPNTGENLFVVKGVTGSLSGAVNTLDPTQNCTASLTGLDGQKYYRTPCAANSTLNGTDQWLLHVVNAGTTNVKQVQFFDQLPTAGDKYLVASETSRGSAYRPQLLDDLKVLGAPSGTTKTIEVTTDTNACVGTWDSLPGGWSGDSASGACSANTWTKATTDTDWATVTGIRVTLDFTTSTDGALKPGDGVDVTYSTKNVVASKTDTTGASSSISSADQFAWNQFGLLYRGQKTDKIAPSQVGVHLRTGSLTVAKKVTGEASSYAPDTIDATVSCVMPGTDGAKDVPLTFGTQTTKTVTLSRQSDGSYAAQRISGIPVGAQCEVKEKGDTGTYGETQRDPADGQTVTITNADTYASGTTDSGDPTNDVPDAQVATLTNTYDWGGLAVTKHVDTKANTGTFGPFTFKVSCTTADGQTVRFGTADSVTFTLANGKTWTAPADTIPARSDCTVTETDKGGADSTVLTGDNVTDHGDGSATVAIGTDTTKVASTVVANHYDAGTFTVKKTVDGDGAATYGAGKFTFHAVCTYGDQNLLDSTFTLAGGETKTFGIYPSGTQCQASETKTGGATSTAVSPANGKVVIGKQDGAQPSAVSVTATNTFETGALDIVKKIDGAGAEYYGAGPFTAKAVCTYQADGVQKTIDLPNGGEVELSAANGYRAQIDNLIVGAECTVTETDAAGANTTTIAPVGGAVTIAGATDDTATVTITNTFKAGQVTVTKKVDGDGATKYGTGTFGFTAVCTWPKGTGLQGAGGTQTTNFELSDGQTKTLGLYPIGTECTVSETTTGGATKHTLDVKDGTVTVPDAVDAQKPSTIGLVATNTFDTADLSIVKKRVGVGAAVYGTGTFTAKAVCTYDRDGVKTAIELPDDGTVKLNQENGYRATIHGLIQGANCEVTETDRGQATSVSVSGEGQLAVSADNAKNVVTITNHFDTAPPAGGTELPRTGASWQLPALGGLLLLLGVGGILLAWFRRRRGAAA